MRFTGGTIKSLKRIGGWFPRMDSRWHFPAQVRWKRASG